jgi:hypothetical protein
VDILIELHCPNHGLERFRIKVIKKYNMNKNLIMPHFRTKPKYELSSLMVGKSVNTYEVREFLIQYFKEVGLIDKILKIQFQV